MPERIWDIRRGYGTYKSVSTDVLQRWIQGGKVSEGEILVWTSGMSGWRRPEDLEEFRSFFRRRKRIKITKQPPPLQKKKKKKKPKVIIIDDEKNICSLLENYLKKRRFSAFSSTTGREGFNLVKTEKPDVVLLDIRLKDTDGLNVLRRINKLRPKRKVIIISAYGDDELRERALRLGANSFMDKPFKRREILKAVREV